MYMYIDEKQTQIPEHGVFSIKTVSHYINEKGFLTEMKFHTKKTQKMKKKIHTYFRHASTDTKKTCNELHPMTRS